jgi:hypothetical protein
MLSDRRTDAHAGLREARRRPHEPHTEVDVALEAILRSVYDEPDAPAVHAEFDRLLRRQMHQLAGPRRVYRPRTGLPDLNNRAADVLAHSDRPGTSNGPTRYRAARCSCRAGSRRLRCPSGSAEEEWTSSPTSRSGSTCCSTACKPSTNTAQARCQSSVQPVERRLAARGKPADCRVAALDGLAQLE